MDLNDPDVAEDLHMMEEDKWEQLHLHSFLRTFASAHLFLNRKQKNLKIYCFQKQNIGIKNKSNICIPCTNTVGFWA